MAMAIDLSSTFNCVEKDLLLEKLQKYNIGQEARGWVEYYLSARTQYVVIGTVHSRMTAVQRGVPQGSVIGPLLYAIHMNEMMEVVNDRGCSQ